jgi:DNA-binding transcriptional LysR family regulator
MGGYSLYACGLRKMRNARARLVQQSRSLACIRLEEREVPAKPVGLESIQIAPCGGFVGESIRRFEQAKRVLRHCYHSPNNYVNNRGKREIGMQIQRDRPVLYGERALQSPQRALPDWDGARIFLSVVRKGSMRAAAKSLKLSVNSLRERVTALEKSVGMTLFTRHGRGTKLTLEGQALLPAAQRMEAASFDMLRASENGNGDESGEVRVAATEGLGSYWIAPHLIEFQRANPRLLIDLNCSMEEPDIWHLEADVAVQLKRPVAQDLRVVKLGRLHFMFFAAESYLITFGRPENMKDLMRHRILIQADDNAQWQQLYDKLFPGVPPAGFVSIRSNLSSAHYWALAGGAGIGILPTYTHVLGPQIVPLDLGLHESVDIWLTYHPDVKRLARVRRVINCLIESFSPQIYPWFRDEFVHPRDFQKIYRGPALPVLFDVRREPPSA